MAQKTINLIITTKKWASNYTKKHCQKIIFIIFVFNKYYLKSRFFEIR